MLGLKFQTTSSMIFVLLVMAGVFTTRMSVAVSIVKHSTMQSQKKAYTGWANPEITSKCLFWGISNWITNYPTSRLAGVRLQQLTLRRQGGFMKLYSLFIKFYSSVVEVTRSLGELNSPTDRMQPTGHWLDHLDKVSRGCWSLCNVSDNSFSLLLGTFNTSEE